MSPVRVTLLLVGAVMLAWGSFNVFGHRRAAELYRRVNKRNPGLWVLDGDRVSVRVYGVIQLLLGVVVVLASLLR